MTKAFTQISMHHQAVAGCSWPKTLVVVSHARNFLNEVATDVVHLHSRKMMVYRGNFDTFEKTAAERLKNARKQAESQQQAKDHMQVTPLRLHVCWGRLGARGCRSHAGPCAAV